MNRILEKILRSIYTLFISIRSSCEKKLINKFTEVVK